MAGLCRVTGKHRFNLRQWSWLGGGQLHYFFTFKYQRIFYPQRNMEGIITPERKAFKIIVRLGRTNI